MDQYDMVEKYIANESSYITNDKEYNLDGYDLKDIPDRCKTIEICQIACKNNGSNLRYVPDSCLTLEMCQIEI